MGPGDKASTDLGGSITSHSPEQPGNVVGRHNGIDRGQAKEHVTVTRLNQQLVTPAPLSS